MTTDSKTETSHKKQLAEIVIRWCDLIKRGRSLDFERCLIARDLRKMFPLDAHVLDGDLDFVTWCQDNLVPWTGDARMSEVHAREMLSFAIAGAVFKDVVQFNAVGGKPGVQTLMFLPRPEQVAIMMQARDQTKRIATVQRERGHADGSIKPSIKPTPALDAKTLAEHISRTQNGDVPQEIKDILRKYVKLDARKSAST